MSFCVTILSLIVAYFIFTIMYAYKTEILNYLKEKFINKNIPADNSGKYPYSNDEKEDSQKLDV